MFFERFDEYAVKIVKEGMDEAKRLGCKEVDTQHLLYGCTKLRDGTSLALEKNKVTAESVRGVLQQMYPKAPSAGIGSMFGQQAKASNSAEMLPFSKAVDNAFMAANKTGKNADDGKVTSKMVLLKLLQEDGASSVLAQLEVPLEQVEEDMKDAAQKDLKELVGGGRKKNKEKSALQQCSTDLTEMARNGKLDACVGREEEVGRVMRILSRRRKNNPCLVGDPGVGKTAIAEGLAQMIVGGEVPKSLRGKRVLSLQMGLLVADTRYRGEFEERLKSVLDEVIAAEDIILFIDELHTLMGAGSAGGDSGMDAAQLMKPALARGQLQCIGATTIEEYRRYIEKDAALERRFQPVTIEEPTLPQTLQILQALKGTYEEHHDVQFTDEALDAAVRYSTRYINDRFLPDKAIDLMDEAGAMVQLASWETVLEGEDVRPVVNESHIAEVVAQWTGIPMQKLSVDDSSLLMGLEGQLSERVIGQQEATKAITKAVWRARTGLRNPARPIASLVFSGPTGVGKTELAKALAESYYGHENNMVRIDMSEYMESHAVSRLVGPPPGYIGYEEGGQLTEAVRRQPHSVVLLDEIEKAHGDVFNLLLQVLEDGRLTDSKGRTVDFRNTILIMTSNIGSKSILDGGLDYAAIQTTVKREMQKTYRPEFLNRLDEIIVFRPLEIKESMQIADLLLASIAKRCAEQGVVIEMAPEFKTRIVAEGFSSKYGARPLRRAVQRWVEDVAAECMLDGFVKKGDKILLESKTRSIVQVTRQDGKVKDIVVDVVQSGMDDQSFDDGGSNFDDLVDMMSQTGLLPERQRS